MSKQNNKRYYIHPEGWKFAGILFITSMILLFLSMPTALVTTGFLLTFFVLWFFRDPERDTPQDLNLIISSADGKVCLIDEAYPPEELPMEAEKMKRICVFMNVFREFYCICLSFLRIYHVIEDCVIQFCHLQQSGPSSFILFESP